MKLSIKIKNTLLVVAATISSMGNYPYAKNFAYFIIENENAKWIAAIVFIFTAVVANIILGVYSLHDSLSMLEKISWIKRLLIGFISFIASCSMGFICFFGYHKTLPIAINSLLSIFVVIVNAGISFSAVNKLFESLLTLFSSSKSKKINLFYFFISFITIIFAVMASFCTYLASTNGMVNILIYWNINTFYPIISVYFLSILVWLPFAALFSYGSFTAMSHIYKTFATKNIKLSWLNFIVLLVAVPSGSAYAQMIIEFFDPSRHIPSLFQFIATYQTIIIYFLMPAGFIISSLVNAYALTNLIKILKK